MLQSFNVLAHPAKNCHMVFMHCSLLRRIGCTPRRMTHTCAVLLFNPDVMGELWMEGRFIHVIEHSWDSYVHTLRRRAMSSNLAVN
jgi:hypothetical protein